MNEQVFTALKDVNNLRILTEEKGEYVVDKRRTVLERLRRVDEYSEKDFYIPLKIQALRMLIGTFPEISKDLGLQMLIDSLKNSQATDEQAEPADGGKTEKIRTAGLEALKSLDVSEELLSDPDFRSAVQTMVDLEEPLDVDGFIAHWQRALRRQKSRILKKLGFESSITGILEYCRRDPRTIIDGLKSVEERAPHATTFKDVTRSIHSHIHRFTKQSKQLSKVVRAGYKLMLLWDPRDQAAIVQGVGKKLHGVVFVGRLPRGNYPPNYLKVAEHLGNEDDFKMVEKIITLLEKNLNKKRKKKRKAKQEEASGKRKITVRFRVCDLHRLGSRLRALSKGKGMYDVELLDDSLALSGFATSPLKRGKSGPMMEIVRKDLCAAYYAHPYFRGCLAYFIEHYEDSFPADED